MRIGTFPSQMIAQQKERMEWLDAMRGFTMMLVVAHHIMSYTFKQYSMAASPDQSVMLLFRMPLFFFVSGFLAYSVRTEWTLSTLCANVLKKLRVQLVPTIVFFMLFEALIRKDFCTSFMNALSRPLKDGFWFTWALLLMFLAYYPFAYLESKWKKAFPALPTWLPITVFWTVGLLLHLSCSFPKLFDYTADWCNYTSIGPPIKYFVFFLSGNICRRYWSGAERMLDSTWMFPVAITSAVLCCGELFRWHNIKGDWTVIPNVFAVFSLLVVVIAFFRQYAPVFSKQNVVGRVMQYVGTRTLDIYLLHYFFLPRLPKIGTWIQAEKPGILVDISLTFLIGALVIALSLFASAVLRTSPLLRKYLFGQKA